MTVSAHTAPHRFINPQGLYDPQPNGYSHVVVAAAPARLVYVAGQGGETVDGNLSADFATQVRQALRNLQTALAAVQAELAHVVKISLLVVDHSEQRLGLLSQEIRAAWGALPTPACTLVPVPRLALDRMLFEIEATAVVPLPHAG